MAFHLSGNFALTKLSTTDFAPCFTSEQGMRDRFVSRNGNTLSRFSALCDQAGAEFDVGDAILVIFEFFVPDNAAAARLRDRTATRPRP